MNLEVLGNLGDFVGGIAVVLTLIYLAVQIRENTKEVRNNTVQALMDRSTGLFGETISSDIPDIQEKELTGERLTEADLIRLQLWFRRNFQFFEQVYLQFGQGRISDEVMQAYERRIVGHFSDERWPEVWASLKSLYTASFSDYIDELQHGARSRRSS